MKYSTWSISVGILFIILVAINATLLHWVTQEHDEVLEQEPDQLGYDGDLERKEEEEFLHSGLLASLKTSPITLDLSDKTSHPCQHATVLMHVGHPGEPLSDQEFELREVFPGHYYVSKSLPAGLWQIDLTFLTDKKKMRMHELIQTSNDEAHVFGGR